MTRLYAALPLKSELWVKKRLLIHVMSVLRAFVAAFVANLKHIKSNLKQWLTNKQTNRRGMTTGEGDGKRVTSRE